MLQFLDFSDNLVLVKFKSGNKRKLVFGFFSKVLNDNTIARYDCNGCKFRQACRIRIRLNKAIICSEAEIYNKSLFTLYPFTLYPVGKKETEQLIEIYKNEIRHKLGL